MSAAHRETGHGESTDTAKAALPRARHATIRDVSRLAEVSRMTVSRTLSNPELVKPATRARVLQAVSDLGYVPDRAAGSLTTRRTGFVALILPTLTNINFSMVAHGLTGAVRAKDFHLLIAYNDYSMAEEEAQLRNLLARRPEAIVLTGGSHSRATNAMLARSDIPVIEIAADPAAAIQHAVGVSNHRAGQLAAQYLIGQGFTKIGALASLPGPDLADHRGEARILGFEEELRHCGLSTDRVLRSGTAPVSYKHGASAIATLLERHPDTEAVFCVSDLSAVGAIMECQRRGIAVPDDLSIMGFGDFDIGRITNPALTTIQVDFHDLGRRAGDLVIELLATLQVETRSTIDVGCTLLKRGSVGAARGAGATA
jgi:LacI family transcriptional regulator, gluconate utilization system Gnt-I transcriptional repressor